MEYICDDVKDGGRVNYLHAGSVTYKESRKILVAYLNTIILLTYERENEFLDAVLRPGGRNCADMYA